MRVPLIIYGAGGLGLEVLSMLFEFPQYDFVGFVDDVVPIGTRISHHKVVGDASYIVGIKEKTAVIIAVGSPAQKKNIVSNVRNENVFYPTIIHSRALLQLRSSINIGHGSIVTAGVIITADVMIGNHVLVNLNTTIGHGTAIGDYVSIMPGVNIAGNVKVKEAVLIGSGANVKNNIVIGEASTIGMGAAVIRDVADNSTVVGVPAKPR
jgi:sugar O-acyltransferase (sialic acid O-acetyltransferase NeuD family)